MSMKQMWWYPVLIGVSCVLVSGWIGPRLAAAASGGATFTPNALAMPTVPNPGIGLKAVLQNCWNVGVANLPIYIVPVEVVDQNTFFLEVAEYDPSNGTGSTIDTGVWITSYESPVYRWTASVDEHLPRTENDVTLESISVSVAAGTWISASKSVPGVTILTYLTYNGLSFGSSFVSMTPLTVSNSETDAIATTSQLAQYFEFGGPMNGGPGTVGGTPSGQPVNGFPNQSDCISWAEGRYDTCLSNCDDILTSCLNGVLAGCAVCLVACVPLCATLLGFLLCQAGCLLLYNTGIRVCYSLDNQCVTGCNNEFVDNMRDCGVILVEH